MTQKEEISAVQPAIREAIDQLAFQTGIPYTLGNAKGGNIKLYEYCTFTVPDHEPLILGVTIWNRDGKLELTLELAEESSGYSHWKVCLGEPLEGGVPKLAETTIANLPKVSVIKKILIPELEPEEPKNQKQLLTELVKSIRMSEVPLDRAVEMVDAFLEHTLKIALARQAKSIVDYLDKYTG